MCHAQCVHLVPDFCGMSMKDANQLLQLKVEAEKNKTRQRPMQESLRPGGRQRPAPSQVMSYQPDSAGQDQNGKQDRYSYDKDQMMLQQQQQQQQGPSSQAASGAAGAAWGNMSPQPSQQQQSQRPAPPRSQSSQTSQAAAAATAALTGKKESAPAPKSPQYQRQPSYPSSERPQQTSPQHAPYNPGNYANVDQRYGAASPPQIIEPSTSPGYGRSPYPPPAASQEPQKQQPPQQIASQPYVAPSVREFVETRPPPASTKGSGKRIGLDHFNFLAVLGKGNFGKVMLAETKGNKQLYAIKVLKKEFIIENDEVESTKSERDVFIIANRARHPFLLNLHACFQTETRVYFVMEYISGGDLMLHIQRGQFGTKRAQFYAAEVCLALKYFHENGVVYRDLKLDNIMLTLDGHIKVADYGLCKKDMYYGATTSTFCGTPEFMAPEVS